MNDQNKKQDKERKGRSAAEIVVLVLAAGIVLFMFGYAIYHAVMAAGTPPRLSATPLFNQVTKRGDFYVLPVEIRNETRPTAEDVRVIVEITKEDGTVEENEIQIAYLAEHSKQKGYVVSKQRPTKDNVSTDVQSYKLP